MSITKRQSKRKHWAVIMLIIVKETMDKDELCAALWKDIASQI